ILVEHSHESLFVELERLAEDIRKSYKNDRTENTADNSRIGTGEIKNKLFHKVLRY
ncbi:565_t:CDS:1, partial [Gigaspora margarita]